jgi:uncharacterized membrane protein YphA (DoxX/SURF4 family)
MPMEAHLGRTLIAAGFIALGIESLLLGIPVMRLETWSKLWPGYAAVGYLSGAIVLAAGGALAFPRWAKTGASVLAVFVLLWLLGLHLPRFIPTIMHGDYWTGVAEALAVFALCWVFAAETAPHLRTNAWDAIVEAGVPYGRICFGLALLVFGAMHFVYHDFVASFIPAWFPIRPFLATATGVAHIAAGLAILSGVLARLGATLAGIMYASWVLVLHIPRVIAAPHDPFEWNGVFVAAILSGGAFLIASTFAKHET